MIFGSDKKNNGIPPFGGKSSCLKNSLLDACNLD